MAKDKYCGRGRPRGTGKPDQPALLKVAELLAADPSLKPTTAIKRVIGIQNDSDIRRLQVKWKAHGSALLAEAKRRREQQERAARQATWTIPRPLGTVGLFGMLSPDIQAIFERQERWRRQFEESPMSRAIREAAQRAKQFESSPYIQAMMKRQEELRRLYEPSPALKAAMEAAERWRKQQAEWSRLVDPFGLRKF